MTRTRFRWTLAATAAVAVALPGLGAWYRRQRLPRCALDGAAIEPIYAVEIVDARRDVRRFCCIRCAAYWLARQSAHDFEVRVADEVTGGAVDANEAFFVRSAVVTNPATGNRIHAFRLRREAEAHAAATHGRLLLGDESPFKPTPDRAGSREESHGGSGP